MFEIISQTRKEILEDFKKNKKKYFSLIKQISQKHKGKAYIFGSYIKKYWKGGSDIDILIVIPENVERIKILKELSEKIKNPIFEFHIIFEKEKELYMKMIKNFKSL